MSFPSPPNTNNSESLLANQISRRGPQRDRSIKVNSNNGSSSSHSRFSSSSSSPSSTVISSSSSFRLSSNSSDRGFGRRGKRFGSSREIRNDNSRLIQFSFASSSSSSSSSLSSSRRHRTKSKPFDKQKYLQSTLSFIVAPGPHDQFLHDPDAKIQWNWVLEAICPVEKMPSCPICLDFPVAPYASFILFLCIPTFFSLFIFFSLCVLLCRKVIVDPLFQAHG